SARSPLASPPFSSAAPTAARLSPKSRFARPDVSGQRENLSRLESFDALHSSHSHDAIEAFLHWRNCSVKLRARRTGCNDLAWERSPIPIIDSVFEFHAIRSSGHCTPEYHHSFGHVGG